MDTIKCPVCDKNLKTITYEKQKVDVCQTCGGIWFDKYELLEVADRLLSENLIEGESVEEAYGKKAVSSEDIDQSQRYCPRCKVGLEVFNYSYDSNVFLDRCPRCLGVWADRRELETAVKHIRGNPEVDKFAETLATELKKSSRLSSKKSKIAAVIFSLFYLVVASVLMGLEGFLRMLMFLVFPLACIFFGESLGRLTGVRVGFSFCRPALTKPTPGFLMVFGGWLLLLLPLFVYIYISIVEI